MTVTGSYVTQFNVIFDQSGLDSTATGTVVTVDGSDKVFTDLPFTTDWLDSGSSLDFAYSDTVASTVTGEQFALVSADQTSPLTVIGPTTTTATYKTQYYLTVTSSHGTTGGEGWYDSGDTAYATVTPLTVAGSDGTQYVFTGWSGDASGTDLTSDGITMDGPKTATADWKTQYYLTVKTDPDGTATIPGEGWYDPGTDVIITAPFEPKIPYLFAYWKVNEEEFPPLNNVIYVHMDGSKTAAAVYKDYLGDAKEEIGGLRGYASGPYRTGKIGRSEYTHFMGDLDKVKPNIDKAIKNLDTQRAGYDDKMNGFEYLRQAVMKLKHIINDVQYWLSKGKIPAADATLIINELETIRMELVNKAWAEALAEKALALKAIADAKARGKDTTRAEKEIAMVDSQLAQAAQKINEGKLAQAIQHFKNAFAHSHNAIKKAQDPAWDIGYKDWIDQLEVMDP
jgi:uncharacterized repeat protein (TIGR02543 family)